MKFKLICIEGQIKLYINFFKNESELCCNNLSYLFTLREGEKKLDSIIP